MLGRGKVSRESPAAAAPLDWEQTGGKEKELYLCSQRCVPERQSIAPATAQQLVQLYSSCNFGTTAPITLVLDREDSLEALTFLRLKTSAGLIDCIFSCYRSVFVLLRIRHNITMLSFLHSSPFIFQYCSDSRVRLKALEADEKVLGAGLERK